MDLRIPVSELMTEDLITVGVEDNMSKVSEIFTRENIHHLPVIDEGLLVGMISKSDFLYFQHGFNHATPGNEEDEQSRLEKCKVRDVMIKGLAKLEPEDRLDVALEVFKENLFHAIPVVRQGYLKGMLTTLDVINYVSQDK